LTSFAGLVVFQALFSRIGLKQQVSGCFRHLIVSPILGHGVIVLLLIVHLLLGYRRLQDMRYLSAGRRHSSKAELSATAISMKC
jgi:hypothetical protein